jgi:integrase
MTLRTNILRRHKGAIYYARTSIPEDIRHHFPSTKPGKYRAEIWLSLRTADPAEARSKGKTVLARWDTQFAELRRRSNPTEADFRAASWNHYEAELDRESKSRVRLPSAQDIDRATARLRAAVEAAGEVRLDDVGDFLMVRDAAAWDREQRQRHIEALRSHLARGETALISWAADDMIRREGWTIAKGSPAYRDLCHRLQRVQIEYLQRTFERDKGDFAGTPTDPVVAPPDHLHGRRVAAPGEKIMDLYAIFAAEKKESVRPDTLKQNQIMVSTFAEFVGETSHVTAITRKAFRDWKQALGQYPANATKQKAFAGMSFRKVVETNGTLKRPTLSKKTINKYLSALAPFTKWLAANDYIPDDVSRGMLLSIDKTKRKGNPFSDDQLKAIFASPLFHRCAGDDQEHELGDVEIRDWRYWIPHIALYSGARLGEIAQLLTADLKQLHGVWVFHITREGSDSKTTKTMGSQRVVPVHSALIKMGLLDYHARMVARGKKDLFPEIEPDARGFLSGKPSRFFNDYFRSIGVKDNREVNFHSFRHSFTDALRRSGYLDEQFGMLLGHTKTTTTGIYGNVPQGILSQRIEMVEAINYPSIC